jgi:hypothetical protein
MDCSESKLIDTVLGHVELVTVDSMDTTEALESCILKGKLGRKEPGSRWSSKFGDKTIQTSSQF